MTDPKADMRRRLCGGSKYVPPGWNKKLNRPELHFPFCNYTGPYTDVQTRWVDKRLSGTNPVDDSARLHDIRYNNLGIMRARNQIDQRELECRIGNADKRLLQTANRNLISFNPLTSATALAVEAGIHAKRGLQDVGLLNKAAFANGTRSGQLIDENASRNVSALPDDYLGEGQLPPMRDGKVDRLHRLRQQLTN